MSGLTPTERAILAYVEDHPDSQKGNISLHVGKSVEYVANVLLGLEIRGLVRRYHRGERVYVWRRVGKGGTHG